MGYSKQFFAYSSNLQANHIVSTLIYQAVFFTQYIQNANLGILPVYIFIYLCFTPTSLVPIEGIITMIRAIKTDQDFDTEWSPFGSHVVLDIMYMTNGTNFRCYASVPCVSMTSIIMFCCYLAFWTTFLYFETYILDFKLSFEHGLQLVNGVSALNGFFAHLIAIFSCFGGFFAANLCSGMFKTIFAFPFKFTGQF